MLCFAVYEVPNSIIPANNFGLKYLSPHQTQTAGVIHIATIIAFETKQIVPRILLEVK